MEARAVEVEAEVVAARAKQGETEEWGQYWEAEAARDRAAALATGEQAAEAEQTAATAKEVAETAEAQQVETEQWGQWHESQHLSYRRDVVPIGRPRGCRGAAALERDWEGLTRGRHVSWRWVERDQDSRQGEHGTWAGR